MAKFKTIIPTEVPEIEIRDYTVQRLSAYAGWIDCIKYVGDTSMSAVFQDVTEAEEYMNMLRDSHPGVTYRLTRKLIVTEVVHA